jgi:hypothetical protein
MKNPIVFVCHSSKDKTLFVKEFVDKLYKHGVNAWYDDYEIKYGDSIIKKINSGLKSSSKGIIVFSKNIMESKFAQNEINSIIYEYIYNENYLIIPVILDDSVEIPPLINHLSKVKIDDLNNYDDKIKDICDIIFGRKELPHIGEPPSYFKLEQLPNCTKQDTDIFKRIGDYCLENSFDDELDYQLLNIGQEFVKDNYNEKTNDKEYIENIIVDTLNILEENEYIKNCGSNVGLPINSMCFTSKGFEYYFRKFVDNNAKICKEVISAIHNKKLFKYDELLDYTNINTNLLKAIIKLFKDKKFIICDNQYNILEITSKGERHFYNFLIS